MNQSRPYLRKKDYSGWKVVLASPNFVPDGFICAEDALNLIGSHDFGDDWTGDEFRGGPTLSKSAQQKVDISDLAQRVGTTPDRLSEEQINEALSNGQERREQEEKRAKKVRDRLRHMLHNEQVDSVATTNKGSGSRIEPRYWLGDRGHQTLLTGMVSAEGYKSGGFLLVARDELLNLLEGQVPSSHGRSKRADYKECTKVGRPSKWKWEAMYIEACAIIHVEGIPETQADLIRRLQEWFTEVYNDAPSDSMMKTKVQLLWRRLMKDNK